jgi:hypothetical protein
MVCYARGAGKVAAIVLIVFLAFGRIVGHYLGEAAVLVAITLATAGASIAAALAFAAFLSTRRNRAAGGGWVSCAFRCQHAMTEQPRRLALVSSVDRRAAPAQRPERVAAPMCSDGPDRSAGPRWPDRPAYRSVPPRVPAPDRRGQRLRA